jgi:CrcB protein
MKEFILVGSGGFLGAIFRYWINLSLPLPTLIVNSAGGFLIGVAFVALVNRDFSLLFVTGFLGAFTTFSAFTLESILLLRSSGYLAILSNVCIHVLCSFTCFLIGESLAKLLSR